MGKNMYKKCLMPVVLVILMLSCTRTINTTETIIPSQAEGVVLDSLSQPLSNYYVQVQGISGYWTNYDQSTGAFKILGLGDGKYTITIRASGYVDTLLSCEIQSQNTTNVGTIKMRAASELYLTSMQVSSMLTNEWNGIQIAMSSFYNGDSLFVFGDSLSIVLHRADISKTIPYSVLIDSVFVKNGCIYKGTSTLNVPIGSGKHVLSIADSDGAVHLTTLYNGYGFSKQICLYISGGGNIPFDLDLDLHLVNSNSDTCNYRNANPIWGNSDSIFSNPRHISGYPNQYSDEIIFLSQPENGTYKLLVHNFHDTLSSVSGGVYLPRVTLVMGDQMLSLSSPRLLQQNELWYIGTVSVPDMIFTQIDSISTVYYP